MFKYDEADILQEVEIYLKSTYSQHYVTEDHDIQTFDVWKSLGSAETTSRDLCIKYLSRYGKKEGKNRKDLLKALHYIFLMLHLHQAEQLEKVIEVANGNTNKNKGRRTTEA